MIKVADKPSTDPIRQKLRLLKKQWNKDISAFIDNLINYKKLTNGQPNKFYKERSSIKDPIPADPATIIGSLAGDFQDLAQRANTIIATQSDYSKNRRKKQPKQRQIPVNVTNNDIPPVNDLSKQLAALEQKYGYELVTEGSNPISRFFTRLLTPTFGVSEAARIRKYRMSLLDACVKTYKSAGKLRVEIVKSSPESITNSNKFLHQFWNDWMLVYRGFTTYKSNMPSTVSDSGGEIETPPEMISGNDKVEQNKSTPVIEEKSTNTLPEVMLPAVSNPEVIVTDTMNKAKNIISDYTKNYRKLNSEEMSGYDKELESAITKFLKSPGQYKPLMAQKVIEAYDHLISALNGVHNSNAQSLGEIFALKNKPATASSEFGLEKVSQDFLKKWWGKTKHQLSMFDKTSAYRLDMYKMATDVRKSLNQLMNSLEKDMNVEELAPVIQKVNHQVVSMRGLMRALHNSGLITPAKIPGKKTNNTDDLTWGQRFDAVDRYM